MGGNKNFAAVGDSGAFAGKTSKQVKLSHGRTAQNAGLTRELALNSALQSPRPFSTSYPPTRKPSILMLMIRTSTSTSAGRMEAISSDVDSVKKRSKQYWDSQDMHDAYKHAVFNNETWPLFVGHLLCCAKQQVGKIKYIIEPSVSSTTVWDTRAFSPDFATIGPDMPAGNGTTYSDLSAYDKQRAWALVAGMTVGDNTADAIANLIKLSTVSKAAHTGAKAGFAVLGSVCVAKAPAVYSQCFRVKPLGDFLSAADNVATWDYIVHQARITSGSEKQKQKDKYHVISAVTQMVGPLYPAWGVDVYVWWLLLLNVLHIKAPVPLHVPVVTVLCAAYDKKYAVIKRTDCHSSSTDTARGTMVAHSLTLTTAAIASL
eukprot:198-Heterococcus_DN1.PRE.1